MGLSLSRDSSIPLSLSRSHTRTHTHTCSVVCSGISRGPAISRTAGLIVLLCDDVSAELLTLESGEQKCTPSLCVGKLRWCLGVDLNKHRLRCWCEKTRLLQSRPSE